MNNRLLKSKPRVLGFSLIEVVLAIGIFLVTVLALVGLLGPTLQSVDEVEKTDEVSSIVNTVNAFLQSSPDIAPGDSKFNTIYNAVAQDNYATIFVFREYVGPSAEVQVRVGFDQAETLAGGATIGTDAKVTDFSQAAGPIYRVVLTPSSVIPLVYQDETETVDGKTVPKRDTTTNAYKLKSTIAADISLYLEGYFAMEVRIFDETPPGPTATFNAAKDLGDLADIEPIFTYNTAIVR